MAELDCLSGNSTALSLLFLLVGLNNTLVGQLVVLSLSLLVVGVYGALKRVRPIVLYSRLTGLISALEKRLDEVGHGIENSAFQDQRGRAEIEKKLRRYHCESARLRERIYKECTTPYLEFRAFLQGISADIWRVTRDVQGNRGAVRGLVDAKAMHDNVYKNPFASGIHNPGVVGEYPRAFTELAIGQCSAELRRRPDWWKSLQDRDVSQNWAQEAARRSWTVASSHQPTVEVKLTEKQVQYLIDELAGYALLRDDKNGCEVSCFERIWESTRLSHGPELDRSLSTLSPPTSDSPKDGSISLIDPYLCPVIYNRSLLRKGPFKLRNARPPMVLDFNSQYALSVAGSLLPSLVSISETGNAKFDSYINNLNPEVHSGIYDVLSKGLTSLIPMFEHVLTDLHKENPLHQRIVGSCKYATWDEPKEPSDPENEEAWTQYERDIREWMTKRPIIEPDIPKAGYNGGLEYRRHEVDLKSRKVKVLVEVEEVNLQPGGADFAATPWHVEGMLNENIVANGLYFTAMENVAPTSLEFRMATRQPRGFMPGDNGSTLRPWGLAEGAPSHQVIGTRPIEPNLAITFPNIYQYRQTGFSLLDPSKPGRLQIVKYSLVNPEVDDDLVVTTAQVAPQQTAWIKQALDQSLDKRIPLEIVDEIVKNVDGAMSPDVARKWGRLIKLEREAFREDNDQHHFCVPFDLWSVGQGMLI